jgi:hypothetical protein
MVCSLEGELSVSDSLDNTRGADEGSELCSVLNHLALSWWLCQAKVASKQGTRILITSPVWPCELRADYRYALGPKAIQLAVRFDAFHDAANCARVTSRLFELEPAPLTLPKGMWTETET